MFRPNLENFGQKLGLFSDNFCLFGILHIQRVNKVPVIMNKTPSFHLALFLVF